jgi:hypothetical protein
MSDWPKDIVEWVEDGVRYLSVPFTWNLPEAKRRAVQGGFGYTDTRLGGPAVDLMLAKNPSYFDSLGNVRVGGSVPALHRHNPIATRTSMGCPNRCGFCAVPITEPDFYPLDSWEVKPILCDNNFLALPLAHRANVYQSLSDAGLGGQVDFNQGLEAGKVTMFDALWLARLKAKVRFACDTPAMLPVVERAIKICRSAGIAKDRLYCYALIGWKDTPAQAWERCRALESIGVTYVCPMWFHELTALEYNAVTEEQTKLGWDAAARKHICGYYWKHRDSTKASRGPLFGAATATESECE